MKLKIRLNENGVPVLDQATMSGYQDAIASVESAGSGDYSAVGPVTRRGDRAYGRYQVMGANIPAWTKEVFGRAMTPQEFLASPEAQDAVFNHKFGQSVEQYGNPQDAASVWFSGRPLSQAVGRRDILGTTPEQYVNKFNAGLGGASPNLDSTVNSSPQFTAGRFGTAQPSPLATPAMGDVVPFARKDLGMVKMTEGVARPGRFGSQWRTQEGVDAYGATRGIPKGRLQPVERPPASISPINEGLPAHTRGKMEASARFRMDRNKQSSSTSWLYGQEANKLGLAQRVADAMKKNKDKPEFKKLMEAWMERVDAAKDMGVQLEQMQALSKTLQMLGY